MIEGYKYEVIYLQPFYNTNNQNYRNRFIYIISI